MKKYTNEFKVGLFLLLAILGLLYLTYSTGKLNIKKSGYHIYAVFDEIAGLDLKAPVMLNGLEVGKVDEIKFAYDKDKTEIILKLFIDSKAKIRENPTISIKTLGLMGEKYIQISSTKGENFIDPESIVSGKPYLDLDALIEQAQTISEEISQQVNRLLNTVNTALEDNQDSITKIVKNLEATSVNFEEFSEDIKRHPWKLLFKTKE